MKNQSLKWAGIILVAIMCVCFAMMPDSVFATNASEQAEDIALNAPAVEEEAVVADPPAADVQEQEAAEEPDAAAAADEAEEPAAEAGSEAPAADAGPQDAEAEDFPAQTIYDTADSGVKVTVSAEEGVLPAESDVSVRELTESEAAPYRAALEKQGIVLENVRFLDVTILDSDEKEIQPDGEVEVSFSNLGFASSDNLVVYHFADDENQQKPGFFSFFMGKGKKLAEPERITPDFKRGGKITFATKHFSVYVVGTEDNYRVKITFQNGDDPTPYMYVKKNDTEAEIKKIIYDPGVSGLAVGEIFRGWTTDQN